MEDLKNSEQWHPEEISLTNHLPEVQAVDIDFHNITYTVHNSAGSKHLLREISGSFKSGQLTAVLGPSGAGKTTLLNLLAGFTVQPDAFEGIVLVNGQPRHPTKFRRMCAYIMQDALIQPQLSVLETMLLASKLKVSGMTHANRLKDIQAILSTLGIASCGNTRTEVLSGGQKKRLTIALELVSNPSILFLDEPTTGLDTHAGKMVMSAMATLASQGRTIVCTVHQPSPLEFKKYDNVYVVARGSCVYNGSPQRLVPFLQEAGVPCPTTYSPADYIIELIQMNPEIIEHLSAEISEEQNHNKVFPSLEKDCTKVKPIIPPNAFTQFFILLGRMLTQRWRNRTALYLQLTHHTMSALLVGLIFYDMGNEASEIIALCKLAMCLSVFYTYTYVMIAILYFPLEIELVKREYFNNWYGPFSYFFSYCFATLPGMIPNVCIFTMLSFYLTGQPMELHRISYLMLIAIFSCYCAEGIGLLIGAFGKLQSGTILGPPTLAIFFALAIYGLGYGQIIEPYMDVFMKFSFLRFSLVGIWLSFFAMDRGPFDCNALYCHWKNSGLILRDMGVSDFSPMMALGGLIAYTILFRVLAYTAIRFRLHADVPGSTTAATVFGLAEKVVSYLRIRRKA